ncbi:alpha-galactosidase [Actinobacteria bacterium YIM 96077]|uniref:alpha-galactosidase n=1 Tax=Phytoactinopolyspora halophila TaxID=1981511 RepID=A0A329QAU7_9ACTN|nr:alpha-galactosidase [Actinobacteria bacterium YIM 96077]RAW09453.1 alpha-galactosidase [Phytoactinopolyspora halophila]
MPRILYWGRDLGDLGDDELAALAVSQQPQQVSNTVDDETAVSVLPEPATGWMGTPGLTGHRDGAAFSALFTVDSVEQGDRADPASPAGPADPTGPAGPAAPAGLAGPAGPDESIRPGQIVTVTASDPDAAIALTLDLGLDAAGVVMQRATVRNAGESVYTLDGVMLALPVPLAATELLDLTGRHLRERSPQRSEFTVGTHVRENRRGRTGLDASLVLAAGEQGFGFRRGEVWAMHVGWSGNHRVLAERTPQGESILAGGELLLPGEVRLAPGEKYTTPWIYGAYGDGLDEVSRRFHDHLRARPGHPRSPRPVTLNTWEAVYFDHDLDRLTELADLAADAGVERFVLDDGWFRGRRNDRAGLGDWYVDETVWPRGLHPLVDHVTKREMQFGLWVEPEMINPDSDLARAHPEWILATGHRMPPEARHQQVLNLAHPDAYAYILERLDALLTEYRIGYLKWDHNRDLVDAGQGPDAGAGVHAQTRATYRLIDELRSRHPGVEIESCSSGGGRVDLGILARTDRVWTSDCIDALERQQIQRWSEVLVPPEMLGAHVGAGVAHTTGRSHSLTFRAGTALFGHFGIEWDLTAAMAAERAELARWVALYKDVRDLLHTGDVVRADHADPSVLVHGVVARDGSRAIYAVVQLATSVQSPTGVVRLPGLDPEARYRLGPLAPGDEPAGPTRSPLRWWESGVELPGQVISAAGVQAPTLYPERLVLVAATRVATAGTRGEETSTRAGVGR